MSDSQDCHLGNFPSGLSLGMTSTQLCEKNWVATGLSNHKSDKVNQYLIDLTDCNANHIIPPSCHPLVADSS